MVRFLAVGDFVTWGVEIVHTGRIEELRPDGMADVIEPSAPGRTWRLAITALTRR